MTGTKKKEGKKTKKSRGGTGGEVGVIKISGKIRKGKVRAIKGGGKTKRKK